MPPPPFSGSAEYVIEPEGDVTLTLVLTLVKPSAPFLILNETTAPSPKFRRIPVNKRSNIPQAVAQNVTASVTYTNQLQQGADVAIDEAAGKAKEEKAPAFLRYAVCAQQLIRASTVFKTMLEKAVKVGGHRFVYITRHDPEAVRIVMNIIHGHTHHVPSRLTIEMLAKVAGIVEQFKLHDSAIFFAHAWAQHCDRAMSCFGGVSRPPQNAVLWMCVAGVFREPLCLRMAAALTVCERYGPLSLRMPFKCPMANTYNLCLDPSSATRLTRSDVRTAIDQARERGLNHTFSALHRLKDSILNGDEPLADCTPEGRSKHLSCLMQDLSQLGLLEMPTAPFLGYSVQDMIAIVAGMPSPPWKLTADGNLSTDKKNPKDFGRTCGPDNCSFGRLMDNLAYSIHKGYFAIKTGFPEPLGDTSTDIAEAESLIAGLWSGEPGEIPSDDDHD
ncbi:hypothetical protein NKR23_g5852 [Pleurostoma richardsiae]|uniref:BTB domain-containing protein n=1 Tax=Pleurostoma richardsiae TaxID=41990 RepID=A0AA38RYF6_9PEZI|nr:hypothetical protein NKR23_g5852 [Pleurostoma richardsiae]